MPTNNIKLFDENKVNMLTDVEYNTNAHRINGVQSGVASSKLQNKTLYQTSLISYAIAQFMNEMGFDASDSGAVSTFVNNLSSSIKKPADSDVKYVSQSLTDEQKQQARGNINAAPGGFGWGEELPRQVSTAAEVDAITANSIVRYANDSTNLVDGDISSYTRYAIVVTYTVNENDKAQDVYGYGGGAHGDVMLHRGRYGNTWLPWEWVNPPMQLGVEYRTTERFNGNPVYAKTIDCGNMPAANSTSQIVWFNDPNYNLGSVISFYAGTTYIGLINNFVVDQNAAIEGDKIYLKTGNTLYYSGPVFAIVKYTKSAK